MYKKDIINFFFVLSFPMYGIGCYLARALSPTRGMFFVLLPFLAIVIFYLIDILYKRHFQIRVKGGIYWPMLIYILTIAGAFFVAVYKGSPEMTFSVAMGGSLISLFVFHAFIVVFLYNGKKSNEVVPRLALLSLGILLFMNVVAYYGLGISSGESYYDGERDDYPFFQGAYEAGTLAPLMFLIVLWLFGRAWGKPLVMLQLVFFLMVLFVIILRVNTRISLLLMMLTMGLFIVKWAKSYLVYWASLFTLPLVLNARYVLYQIMNIPLLKPMMARTDFEDVVTLHGRSYLWERGVEWMMYDQRGLFFGLGYYGQYFIGLLRDIQKVWHPENPYTLHWHCATLQILVDQGIVGLVPLLFVLYKLFGYYRQEFISKRTMGMFFPVVVFLLFSTHIDTFIIFQSIGTTFFFLLVAGATVKSDEPAEGKVSDFSKREALPATTQI